MRLFRFSFLAFLTALLAAALPAQVPQLLNYQGRVASGGANFHGHGQFRFALVDAAGGTTYWSNDGTSVAGSAPAASVSLTVSNGLYTVLLGDNSLPNMTPIPGAVFNNPHVRLRVWFDDGTNGSQQLAPDQRIAAVGYAIVAGNVPDGAITAAKLAPGAVTASAVAAGAISSSQLAVGAAAANLAASGQSGVASGGLILGASANSPEMAAAGYIYYGAVNVNDVWTQRSSTNAPSPRYRQSAVWTGSELIIWGGIASATTNTYLADGGRYTPATDSWTSIPAAGAPLARAYHTAVWTGTRMIIWGGLTPGDNPTLSGSRYDPATGSWASTLSAGAPLARSSHTAVWTGTEMIVYGGSLAGGVAVDDGARYTLATNSWAALPEVIQNNPIQRTKHTAIWTGTDMIIWGGTSSPTSFLPVLNTGARYNRASNTWSQLSTNSAPAARAQHAAVWTGSEMIIWGGAKGTGFPGNEGFAALSDGGRYLPSTNTWVSMSLNGPPGRLEPPALWTGSALVIYGGGVANGGVYSPARNTWQSLTLTGAPSERYNPSFVWTGTQGLFFGGADPFATPAASNEIWGYTPPRNLHLYARP